MSVVSGVIAVLLLGYILSNPQRAAGLLRIVSALRGGAAALGCEADTAKTRVAEIAQVVSAMRTDPPPLPPLAVGLGPAVPLGQPVG